MKRTVWLTVAGVLAFAAIVIARLPASWVVPSSSDIACSEVGGTIWSGTCAGLTAFRQPVGDLAWELHGSRLLAGKVNALVVLTRPTGTARGTVEAGLDKVITARDVEADFPIEPSLSPQIPRDLHGNIHVRLALIRVSGQRIQAIEGTVEARNLEQGVGSDVKPLGGYSLTFPAGAPDLAGQLRDLDGPLAVEGTLRLTPEPGYELHGLVKPRDTAPPDLVDQIRYLGSPDAQGRRPFSISGTF